MSQPSKAKPSGELDAVLGYLQHRMPAYPFDPELDKDFAEELIHDFGSCVLEEIKSFRWFYSDRPVDHLRSVRLAVRRWIANSKKRRAS